MTRIASVKETGEELTPAEWQRFEDAVAAEIRQRPQPASPETETLRGTPPQKPEDVAR